MADGNRTLAARLLGIHRTALYKNMNRLGILPLPKSGQ
ncbi:MAG: helix-turn-helix domain-containing protein [Pseudomonadota bacterium]